MNIQILAVPYDSGYKTTRMGRGPGHLLIHGLADILRSPGHTVAIQRVEVNTEFSTEIATSFELYRLLSTQVELAQQEGRFPLVLAGNCGSTLGALSGLEQDRLGLIWFDAHGDFNTPDTTTSGFLDGMPLAIINGRCWRSLAESIPGFAVLPGERIVHIGARDLEPQEERLLHEAGIAIISPGRLHSQGVADSLAPVFEALRPSVDRVYLHLDLDVLDPAEARANHFSPPGGLALQQMVEAIDSVRQCFTISGTSLASYDPDVDRDGRAMRAAFRLLERVVSDSP